LGDSVRQLADALFDYSVGIFTLWNATEEHIPQGYAVAG